MTLEDYDEVVSPRTGKKINMKKLLQEQHMVLGMLSSSLPFFEVLLSKFKWVYTWDVPTQATDGTRIFVNPEFTDKLSQKEKAFVMAHEAMHCALQHHTRCERLGHELRRSNVAGDYEINGQLVKSGLWTDALVNHIEGLLNHKFDDQGYEHIYSQVSGNEIKEPGMGDMKIAPKPSDNDKNPPGWPPVNIEYDEEWMDGWNKAIEDYQQGKLKLQ